MPRYTRWEIIGSLCAAGLAAYSVYWWMMHFYSQRELVPVVAAARDLEPPQALTLSDVISMHVPRNALPKDGIIDVNSLVGKVLVRAVSEKQIILTRDIIANYDPDSAALLVPPGKIGAVLAANWLTAAFPKIKPNDFIDIYAAFPARQPNSGVAGAVLTHLLVLGVTSERGGAPSAVFLALDAMQASKLIQLHASQYPLLAVVEPAHWVTTASSSRP